MRLLSLIDEILNLISIYKGIQFFFLLFSFILILEVNYKNLILICASLHRDCVTDGTNFFDYSINDHIIPIKNFLVKKNSKIGIRITFFFKTVHYRFEDREKLCFYRCLSKFIDKQ